MVMFGGAIGVFPEPIFDLNSTHYRESLKTMFELVVLGVLIWPFSKRRFSCGNPRLLKHYRLRYVISGCIFNLIFVRRTSIRKGN